MFEHVVVKDSQLKVADGPCRELEEKDMERVLVVTELGVYTLRELYSDNPACDYIAVFRCYSHIVVVEYEWVPDRDEFGNNLRVTLYRYAKIEAKPVER